MKYLIAGLFMALTTVTINAQRIFTRTGHIQFLSTTPVEDIEAHNKEVTSVIDQKTGAIQFAATIKSFQFEKALLQEHFNENYMESNTYSKATFKGNIENLADIKWTTDGSYMAKVKGDLTIHGETRTVEMDAQIMVKKEQVSAETEFNIQPEEHGIEIPDMVRDKIAKEVMVIVKCQYEPYNK